MVRLSTSKYAAAVPDIFWFTSEVEALKTYCPVIHKTLKTNCDFETAIPHFSINTQVIKKNRALSLVRCLGLSADNHLDGQNGCQ